MSQHCLPLSNGYPRPCVIIHFQHTNVLAVFLATSNRMLCAPYWPNTFDLLAFLHSLHDARLIIIQTLSPWKPVCAHSTISPRTADSLILDNRETLPDALRRKIGIVRLPPVDFNPRMFYFVFDVSINLSNYPEIQAANCLIAPSPPVSWSSF